MANSADVDISRIVLIFGDFSTVDDKGTFSKSNDIPQLSDNSEYEFKPSDLDGKFARWTGVYALEYEKNIFHPQGWFFGSSDDTAVADFQLAKDVYTGISRTSFKIDIHPILHKPRLTNESRNPLRIHQGVGADAETVTLFKGESFTIIYEVTIDLGPCMFQACPPTLSSQEKQRYEEHAEKFSMEFLAAVPKRPLDPQIERAATFGLRFGLNNTIYRQEHWRATGSFGSVMRVMELRSKKIFAAKEPHSKSNDSAGKARRNWEELTKEFKNLMALSHPNIVQAIDVLPGMQENDPPWLIMEWIPDDLGSITLDDTDVPLVLAQIISGLAFIHDAGYVHRDLKPANILIKLDGRSKVAKIADFGTSKYFSGEMQSYTGTLAYMAPEFFHEKLSYTRMVDMWSYGVIALEMLTRWDINSDGWNPHAPSMRSQQQKWIKSAIQPRFVAAPEMFRRPLRNILRENFDERWSSALCEEWMLENVITSTGDQKNKESNKRPGSWTLFDNNVRTGNNYFGAQFLASLPDTEPAESPRLGQEHEPIPKER